MNNRAVVVGNLNMLRCLAASRVPVVLATSIANRVGSYSRYRQSAIEIPGPTRTPVEFIESLVDLADRNPDWRSVLYYDGDADLLCISRQRDRLEDRYLFNLPPEQDIEAFIDKARFDAYAKELRLPTPPSVRVNSIDEEQQAVREVPLPVIVKPVSRVGWLDSELAWKYGDGGKGFLARTKDELLEVLAMCRGVPEGVVAQKLVEGPESNVLSYHSYVDASGNIRGEFTGRKHRTFPAQFGRSSAIEVCDLPEVRRLGRDMIDRMSLTGVSKLDFKRDDVDGRLYLFEVNARFSIWNYPGATAGVNLPLLAYEDLTGEKVHAGPRTVVPVRWVDGALDRKTIGERGGWYIGEALKNCSSRTVYNVWSVKDPMPWLYQTARRLFEIAGGVFRRLRPGKQGAN